MAVAVDDHRRPVGVAVGRRHVEVVHVGALEQRPVIVCLPAVCRSAGVAVVRIARSQRSGIAGECMLVLIRLAWL